MRIESEEVEMSIAKPRSLSVVQASAQHQSRTIESNPSKQNNSSNSSLHHPFNPINGNLASSLSGVTSNGLAQLAVGDLAVSPSLPNMITSSLSSNPHRYKTLVRNFVLDVYCVYVLCVFVCSISFPTFLKSIRFRVILGEPLK